MTFVNMQAFAAAGAGEVADGDEAVEEMEMLDDLVLGVDDADDDDEAEDHESDNDD